MSRDRVIVIGAGIGGLVSAALLAAQGRDVIVIERAATAGGKLRRIRGVDAGPTVFTMRPVFEAIFARCGAHLDSALPMKQATTLARHAWAEDTLDLFADPSESEAAIGTFAGAAEASGYRAFRAESKRIFEALDGPFLRRTNTDPLTLGVRMGLRGLPDYLNLRAYTSLWTALGTYFRDPRLRQLFARYATYCGSSPFAAPATLMLIAHVEAAGVWMIDGGMFALVEALEALARRNGAVFRFASPVREIVVVGGRAAGVVLANGERMESRRVLCNADPATIGSGAMGTIAARAVRPVRPSARSLSAMVWTGRARASGFPMLRHNVFFSEDYGAEFAMLSRGLPIRRPSVYVCAQDRDDSMTRGDGQESVQIIVNAPANGDQTQLSREEIEQCTQAMQATLDRAGLSLHLDPSAVLTTPTDFEALFPSTGGALYGRASHGWAASFLRQGSRTRIPGLYCAGGSTHPGAGVPMAALSAISAVDCLLKDPVSTSWWHRAAMPGGTSTPPAPTPASV